MTFTFRPLDPLKDAALVHRWVTHPQAAFWLARDAKLVDVERACMRIAADERHHALLGLRCGVPVFLMETYDPAVLHESEPGDIGLHLLASPAYNPVPGLLLRAALTHLFADPAVRRVVLAPDAAGAATEHKAPLAFRTREEFYATTATTATSTKTLPTTATTPTTAMAA
ncbi:GNAT family N-acetyltransferase [Streptomyces sp. NPDC090994]|uniref:GNAT family N-acetyltransferase n=1 Tax=Streptomyces sp. NPDC090994 TaxID=3365969 RepID=UPI00381C9224